MTERKSNVSAADIRAALRDRFPRTSHALLFEVANGTGALGTRRADAIAMGLWPSHGLEIDGFEIKVSRSDWLRELRDHNKADEIARYCHRWWVATPAGIVKPDELPSGWGLIELHNSGQLRQKTAPAKTESVEPDRPFVAAMLRRAAEGFNADVDALVSRSVEQEKKRLQDQFENRLAMQVRSRTEKAEEAMVIIAKVKESTGIDLMQYAPSEDIVKALRFAEEFVANRWGPSLESTIEQMKKVTERLEELTAPAPTNAGGEASHV